MGAAPGATIQRVRAIIFDWDGTLADTVPFMFQATETVMSELGIAVTFEQYRSHFTPDWRDLYRRLHVPSGQVEAAGRRWWTIYRGIQEAPLLPGAARAVRRLDAAGFRLGLVTAGDRANIEPQLRRHGLADLLGVCVFGDDLVHAKPHPAPLQLALAGLAMAGSPIDATYVGDAPDDMRMARAVGAHAVGIRGALGDEPNLREAGAEEVADSVDAWVDGLLKTRV